MGNLVPLAQLLRETTDHWKQEPRDGDGKWKKDGISSTRHDSHAAPFHADAMRDSAPKEPEHPQQSKTAPAVPGVQFYSHVLAMLKHTGDPDVIADDMIDYARRAAIGKAKPTRLYAILQDMTDSGVRRGAKNAVQLFRENQRELVKKAKAGLPPPLYTGETGLVLATADVNRIEELGGGINYSYKAHLDGGTKGIWKPAYGEASNLQGTVKGDYWLREAAASELGHILNMQDLIPPTAVRAIDGHPGSIQKYVPNADAAAARKLDKWKYNGELDHARSAAFDVVIGNQDRHQGNWLIRHDDDRLQLIDHGISFPDSHNEIFSNQIMLLEEAVARDLLVPESVREWDSKADTLAEILKHYERTPEEIDLAARRLRAVSKNAGGSFKDVYQSIGNI